MVKKWKGKDWFNILAPKDMEAAVLGETPTTDPKTLVGRNIEFGAQDVLGRRAKNYMKMRAKITGIEGKTCLTAFNGFECTRDHLARMVRKRNRKVEGVFVAGTKDGWELRIKPCLILAGIPPADVGSKIRNFSRDFIAGFAGKNTMGNVIRKILSTELQMMLKKQASKIYPVRFSEIARIKVLRSPEFDVKRSEEKAKGKPKKKAEETGEEGKETGPGKKPGKAKDEKSPEKKKRSKEESEPGKAENKAETKEEGKK